MTVVVVLVWWRGWSRGSGGGGGRIVAGMVTWDRTTHPHTTLVG